MPLTQASVRLTERSKQKPKYKGKNAKALSVKAPHGKRRFLPLRKNVFRRLPNVSR